jgi:hypothetical protein
MSADGSVPLAGLNIFIHGPFLQQQFSPGIKDMQVNNRMQHFAPTVTFATGSLSDYPTRFVNQWKYFFRHTKSR